jgi:hypothetical protein
MSISASHRHHLRLISKLATFLASHQGVEEPVYFGGVWMDMRTFVSMPVALRVRAQMTGITSRRRSRRPSVSSSSTEDESDSVNTSRPTTQSTIISSGDPVIRESRTSTQTTVVTSPAPRQNPVSNAVIALESSPSPAAEAQQRMPVVSSTTAEGGFNFDATVFRSRVPEASFPKAPCVPRSGPGSMESSRAAPPSVASPGPTSTTVSRSFTGIGDLFSSIFGDTSASPPAAGAASGAPHSAYVVSPSRPPLAPNIHASAFGAGQTESPAVPRRSARGGPPSHSSTSADSSNTSLGNIRARSDDQPTPPSKQHRRW